MQLSKIGTYEYMYMPCDTPTEITLLLLHGTGGDEHSLIEISTQIAPHANLLSVRGNVLEGTMHRFFARLAEGILDEDDIRTRAQELTDFIEEATATHQLSETKLVAVGFSNGANMATALLQLFPEILSGAILLRAMPPFITPPTTSLHSTPILLQSGQYDTMIAPEAATTLAEQLRASGAALTHIWQPVDHGLTTQDILEAQNWLATNI